MNRSMSTRTDNKTLDTGNQVDCYIIRPMQESDNEQIAHLIRCVIDEHGASRTNSVYDDPQTDDVFKSLLNINAEYWVIEYNHKVVGGGGFFPTDGLPEKCAEIVKFYLMPTARGKGLGAQIFDFVIDRASHAGYNRLYLETVPLFSRAVDMYKERGFDFLNAPIGNTGHSAPSIFMSKWL